MLIVKSAQAQEVEDVLALLSRRFGESDATVQLHYQKNGFFLRGINNGRYVYFTSHGDHDGYMLECGLILSDDIGQTVMCNIKQGALQLAACNIFNWFTVENGPLFKVEPHCGISGYNANRIGGVLHRTSYTG